MSFSLFEVVAWAVGIIVVVIFMCCFVVAFAVSMIKFGAGSDKSILEETDKWWLVIVSPFHIPSNNLCEEPSGDCTRTEFAWYTFKNIALAVATVVMFLPSIVFLALFMTGNVIFQTLTGAAKKVIYKMPFTKKYE